LPYIHTYNTSVYTKNPKQSILLRSSK